MPFGNEDRRGRLDLLIKDGLGMVADRAGVRAVVQPVIDLFVDEKIRANRVPVTPVEIAQHLGILRKPKRIKTPQQGAA